MATRVGASPSSAPHFACSSSSSVTLTPQARRTFRDSFEKFEKTVQKHSKNDRREFNNTTLRDVREAAKEIEQQLAARQCLRNLKRLQPLLNGLEAYSKVVEVLCNGTPFLPWIWAPIKLMMTLATDHISVFEKLISAYAQIAENLPRFDRLSNAFCADADFQQVLAVLYSDILDFHRQAYKFLRRNGWKCFFKSSWGQFGARFECILESIERHSKLVDQEANANLISETMAWRKEAKEAAVKLEKERSATQLLAALSWLGIDQLQDCGQKYQENTLRKLVDDCCPGTTDWLMTHTKMRAWLQDGRGQSMLWLRGKPGAGKSTIVAKIANSLKKHPTQKHGTVLFCFYGYRISRVYSDPVMFILATLVSQILRHNIKFAAYVYAEFVIEAYAPSIEELHQILSDLVPQLTSPRILIDGIDECIQYDSNGNPSNLNPVREVIQAILQLEQTINGASQPKILLASRDVLQLTGKLSRKPMLSLDEEETAVTADIRHFTKQRLLDIQERFESLPDLDSVLSQVENKIVLKSQGMFLWVHLVLSCLEEDAYNRNDLEAAIVDMPVALDDFYGQIFARVIRLRPISQRRAISAINWMICARRPLRVVEVQDAIVFSTGHETLTEDVKLPATILDLCKPLIQTHADGYVSFVHFTVQEFLLSNPLTSKLASERCVALSCLTYLNFSLDLIQEHPEASDPRTTDIGKCLHTLLPYANEHWIEHVLAFAEVQGPTDTQFKDHLDRLLYMINCHRQQDWDDLSGYYSQIAESASDLEPRLKYIHQYGPIMEALERLVQHRHIKKLHFHDTSFAAISSDLTPFSLVHSQYRTRVAALLSNTSFPGLTSVQLAYFQQHYRPFAFQCRFPDCMNISAGFSTEMDRAQHEKSHAPPLLCTRSGCTYTLAFNSLQSLKRHIREFHEAVPRKIPTSIRPQRIQYAASSRHVFDDGQDPINLNTSFQRDASNFVGSQLDSHASTNQQSTGPHPVPLDFGAIVDSPLTSGTIAKPSFEDFGFHYYVQRDGGAVPQGWQNFCLPKERADIALKLFTQYRPLRSDLNDQEALRKSLRFENNDFLAARTKEVYVMNIKSMLDVMTAARQDQLKHLKTTEKPVDRHQLALDRLADRTPLTEAVRLELLSTDFSPAIKSELLRISEGDFRDVLERYCKWSL